MFSKSPAMTRLGGRVLGEQAGSKEKLSNPGREGEEESRWM
jgi:hypothetical protein